MKKITIKLHKSLREEISKCIHILEKEKKTEIVLKEYDNFVIRKNNDGLDLNAIKVIKFNGSIFQLCTS